MDDLTIQLVCMLLQHLQGLWVGLLGNDNRAVGPHDACLGFSNRFNAATFGRHNWHVRTYVKEGGLHPTSQAFQMSVECHLE